MSTKEKTSKLKKSDVVEQNIKPNDLGYVDLKKDLTNIYTHISSKITDEQKYQIEKTLFGSSS